MCPVRTRITTSGYSYDANGNMTAMPSLSGMVYDVENRLTQVTHSANGTDQYAYDPWNRRVWKHKPVGSQKIIFYGIDGLELGTYSWGNGTLNRYKMNVYFAGRFLGTTDKNGAISSVVQDRLGSVVGGTQKYFPYGEEPETTQQDRVKFATYYRDATTALDYAVNRYYGRTIGRFLSPDPYRASGGPADPQSWNRYRYSDGDPVNGYDPTGLMTFPAEEGRVPTPSSEPNEWCMSLSTGVWLNSLERYARYYWCSPGSSGGGGLSLQQIAINAAMRASDRLFRPDCAGLFLAPAANTPEQRAILSGQLQDLADRGDLRVISPDALPEDAPANVPAFTRGLWGFIYVVSGRSFFTNTLNGQSLGGAFQGLSLAQTQELIIIHEFLHADYHP